MMLKKTTGLIFLFVLILHACTSEKGEVAEPACEASYANEILPIMQASCTPGCHEPGGVGPGDFNDYDALKSKVTDGQLESRVVVNQNMPPPPGSLTEAEIDLIKCWIDNGGQNN